MIHADPSTGLRTGFIGLGSQGGPMAERIVGAGFPLAIWARRPEALESFVAKGATTAGAPAELAAACDYLGICVLNDAGVAEICDTAIPQMRPGSILAIHSTVLPETCIALAEHCAERGILFLDAPVSGGAPAAAAGTLTVMCGGTTEAFEAARPVLETFGKLIVLLGKAGAGQRAKLVNNALMAANLGLAHAAMGAGAALGLNRAALAELVSASSGRSFAFEVYARIPEPVGPWMGAPLLRKDVDLLSAALPDNPSAAELAQAAEPFLAATGAPGARS